MCQLALLGVKGLTQLLARTVLTNTIEPRTCFYLCFRTPQEN